MKAPLAFRPVWSSWALTKNEMPWCLLMEQNGKLLNRQNSNTETGVNGPQPKWQGGGCGGQKGLAGVGIQGCDGWNGCPKQNWLGSKLKGPQNSFGFNPKPQKENGLSMDSPQFSNWKLVQTVARVANSPWLLIRTRSGS